MLHSVSICALTEMAVSNMEIASIIAKWGELLFLHLSRSILAKPEIIQLVEAVLCQKVEAGIGILKRCQN